MHFYKRDVGWSQEYFFLIADKVVSESFKNMLSKYADIFSFLTKYLLTLGPFQHSTTPAPSPASVTIFSAPPKHSPGTRYPTFHTTTQTTSYHSTKKPFTAFSSGRVAMKVLWRFLLRVAWYWINDFVPTFKICNTPIYIGFWSQLV